MQLVRRISASRSPSESMPWRHTLWVLALVLFGLTVPGPANAHPTPFLRTPDARSGASQSSANLRAPANASVAPGLLANVAHYSSAPNQYTILSQESPGQASPLAVSIKLFTLTLALGALGFLGWRWLRPRLRAPHG